jgi:hypothetical protein
MGFLPKFRESRVGRRRGTTVSVISAKRRGLFAAVLFVALAGAFAVLVASAPDPSSSPAFRVPTPETQRAFVVQLNAVAVTVSTGAQAWSGCTVKSRSAPAELAACQALAYGPTARTMRRLGASVGQIGSTVPGTHCAAAAKAAAAGMPAAAAQWGSGLLAGSADAVTPEGKALALAYDTCTARPVWRLNGFPGALYGP